MGLLYYVSYVALLAAFAFVTLSLASGLLYVSELIEEHSRLAKVVGQRSIYVIILLHAVFYFTDSLPFLQIVFSMICHVVYLQNFSNTWPLISLTSLTFLSSCALVVADHFIWFFYFSRITTEARQLKTYRGITRDTPGFAEIASFFGICVWFAPLFLFLSLSANDNALPVTTIEPSSPSVASMVETSQGRVSLFRSMFSFLSFDSIPIIRPRPSRKHTAEGLLAPHSPIQIRSPLPSPLAGHSTNIPSSPSTRQHYPPPPLRSPGPRTQELDMHLSPSVNNSFKLNTPPARRAVQPVRQASGEGLGLRLGTRRSTGSNDEDW